MCLWHHSANRARGSRHSRPRSTAVGAASASAMLSNRIRAGSRLPSAAGRSVTLSPKPPRALTVGCSSFRPLLGHLAGPDGLAAVLLATGCGFGTAVASRNFHVPPSRTSTLVQWPSALIEPFCPWPVRWYSPIERAASVPIGETDSANAGAPTISMLGPPRVSGYSWLSAPCRRTSHAPCPPPHRDPCRRRGGLLAPDGRGMRRGRMSGSKPISGNWSIRRSRSTGAAL